METQEMVTQFYQGILGIPSTWKVVTVVKDSGTKEIHITLEYARTVPLPYLRETR